MIAALMYMMFFGYVGVSVSLVAGWTWKTLNPTRRLT